MGWLPKKKPATPGRRGPAAGQRSNVFSYYATSGGGNKRERAPGEERRLRETETIQLRSNRDHIIRNLPLLIASLVIVLGIIYNTTLSSNPQVIVNSVTKEQTYLRDKNTYQDALHEEFSRSVLNASKLTVDTQEIADAMITRFPELADVSVTLPLLGRNPVVQLEATRPALILISGDGTYVLDGRGIVLMDARELTDKDGLVVVKDESSLPVETGKPALTESQVAFIRELQRQLEDKKLSVKEMILPARAQQVDVYFTDVKYHAKFLFLSDSRVVAGSFIALKKDLERRGITPRDYIDARLEGRLYYK